MLEDDPNDADLIERHLKRSDLDCETMMVSCKEDFVEALDNHSFDIILSDHQLPQFSSFEALQIRNNKNIVTPFILVTGSVSEEYAATVIQEGANDYILKDRLQRLPNAIEQAIQKQRHQQEKIKAEKELLQSNQRFEYASKATSDTIWDYNLITGELFLTESFETLFGYKLNELQPNINSWVSYIHPDDVERVLKGLDEVINSCDQTSWSDQYRYIKANGTIANVLDKGIILRDPANNKPYRMVGAMQDVTELVKSNNDLKQFSYIISHNLYAPLSNLLGLINLFDYSTFDTTNKEMMDLMKASTYNLKQTIDDLSNILIIKNVQVELKDVKVMEVIDKVKSSLRHKMEAVQPDISINLKLETIKSHQFYLESIFQNLIDNSLKYKKSSEPLVIKIATEKILNNRVLITYTDNGLGIDLNRHKEKIFGMYQRFHDSAAGKGLGLFIVKSQVAALGGYINLHSEPEKGITFQITL